LLHHALDDEGGLCGFGLRRLEDELVMELKEPAGSEPADGQYWRNARAAFH
jgi:hypothetical protein